MFHHKRESIHCQVVGKTDSYTLTPDSDRLVTKVLYYAGSRHRLVAILQWQMQGLR
jgi:hypothetical protein